MNANSSDQSGQSRQASEVLGSKMHDKLESSWIHLEGTHYFCCNGF
jgi:hypothetical protein